MRSANSSPTTTPPPTRRPALKQRLAVWMRWLHIYSSMAGLAAVLFFSITGLTLNHPDWMFGSVRDERELTGQIPSKAWLGTGAEEDVSRLEIAEHLRRQHGLRGFVDEFLVEPTDVTVVFKGPGLSADAVINRATGSYTLTLLTEGWVAVINDLHKGRHTGPVWSWILDLSAIMLIVISLTGLALLFYIKRRRLKGLLLSVGSGLFLFWLWWAFMG